MSSLLVFQQLIFQAAQWLLKCGTVPSTLAAPLLQTATEAVQNQQHSASWSVLAGGCCGAPAPAAYAPCRQGVHQLKPWCEVKRCSLAQQAGKGSAHLSAGISAMPYLDMQSCLDI